MSFATMLAYERARRLLEKLKQANPNQTFEIVECDKVITIRGSANPEEIKFFDSSTYEEGSIKFNGIAIPYEVET